MPLTPQFRQSMLDWALGGANPTQPTQRWLQWATASPTTASAFDGPFTSRQTVTFAAANSPQMSKTNLNLMTFVTATAVATAVGWNIYDAAVGGNRIAYGTCTAVIGCKSADQPSFNAGGLKIVLT